MYSLTWQFVRFCHLHPEVRPIATQQTQITILYNVYWKGKIAEDHIKETLTVTSYFLLFPVNGDKLGLDLVFTWDL